MTRWIQPGLMALVILAVVLPASGAHAQIDCGTLSHWTNLPAPPQVNQAHIFCGEVDTARKLVKGFHSRPGGKNPSTVSRFVVSQPPNAQGIYGGKWTANPSGFSKSSTMFPDSCSMSQVINSVLYASKNTIACPAGAPSWAKCGRNAPPGGNPTYCNSANGAAFTIAWAKLGNGNINTAFPLR